MAFMYSEEILEEIRTAILAVKEEEVFRLAEELQKAGKVFCDGLGRSGLICRAFAMRLMHLGINTAFVGDTVTTAIAPGDLLLLCSGSGGSEALVSHARKAKQNGARVALLTGHVDSVLGKMADIRVNIPVLTKEEVTDKMESRLPMGTLFEGTAALVFENLVLELMEQRQETSESMFQRHANLE